MEEAKTFSVGDIVRLKSGGPVMTVEKVRGDTLTCVWFDGKKAHDRKFLAVILEGPDEVGEMLKSLKEEQAQKAGDVPNNGD
jgi:uncharacterized protein YodC (DUF2158 family)